MELQDEYKRIMKNANKIALATSIEGIPNVRIVNYCFDSSKKGTLYFSTLKGSPKIKEFNKNSTVAFTTIPDNGKEHVRVLNATIKKSEKSLEEVKDLFLEQVPGFSNTLEVLGGNLVIYEILFKNVTIILSQDKKNTLTL